MTRKFSHLFVRKWRPTRRAVDAWEAQPVRKFRRVNLRGSFFGKSRFFSKLREFYREPPNHARPLAKKQDYFAHSIGMVPWDRELGFFCDKPSARLCIRPPYFPGMRN